MRDLEMRGQPREILDRIRSALDKHVRQHTRNRKGAAVGGGAILSAQWRHRLSRDVDLHIDLVTTEDARKILDTAAEASGGYRLEHPEFQRIKFGGGDGNHVDVSIGTMRPAGTETMDRVDGKETQVLSNAQIMTGKIKGRGLNGPTRDLFDIVICERLDPEALEMATNSIPDEYLVAILKLYEINKRDHEVDVERLEDVPKELKPVTENLTALASNALLRTKYELFELTTREGKAEVRTATVGGTIRRRTYRNGEELATGFERSGVSQFLESQYRSVSEVMGDTAEAMWKKENRTILAIRPVQPSRETTDVPDWAWPPEGNGKKRE